MNLFILGHFEITLEWDQCLKMLDIFNFWQTYAIVLSHPNLTYE